MTFLSGDKRSTKTRYLNTKLLSVIKNLSFLTANNAGRKARGVTASSLISNRKIFFVNDNKVAN